MVNGLNGGKLAAGDNISQVLDLLSLGDAVALQVLIFLVGTDCIRQQNECVRLQLLELETNNKTLALLNGVLGVLLAFKATLPTDIKASDPVTLPPNVQAALQSINVDPTTVKTYGDFSGTIETLRSRIDQFNSIGQTFATRLQMEINTLQVFSDMTTNSMQTQFNSLKAIVRNLV